MKSTHYFFFILPALSGLILGLVFYGIIPTFCVFVSLVPLIIFVDRMRSVWQSTLGGFITGFVYFIFVLHTLVYIEWFGFVSDESLFLKVAYIIACVVGGATYALFAGVLAQVWKRGWLILFGAPALFIFVELIRRVFAFGFTWGFLGYLTEDMPFILQSASVVGVLGISFIIVCVNVGVTLALLWAFEQEYLRAGKALMTVGLVVCLSATSAYVVQTYMLSEIGSVRVAVMETGNQHGSMRLDVPMYRSLFETAREAGAELILMPESLIDPRHKTLTNDEVTEIIADLAGDYEGTVVVGGLRREAGKVYNSAFFWHDGALVDTYDKHFLVPFAEYSPYLFSKYAPKGATLYERGGGQQSFAEAGGVRLGTLVCQEVNYPEASRRPARSGAEILVSGANDGFVETPEFLQQFAPAKSDWFHELEYRYARYRAVESGRYLARSTKIGIAGFISYTGENVASIGSGTRDVLVRDIPRMTGQTPYVRFGDTPLVVVSFLLVYIIFSRRVTGDKADI